MNDSSTTACTGAAGESWELPVIELTKWYVRFCFGQMFVTGWRVDVEGAEVSLPLVELNCVGNYARAAVGQTYRLIGPQGTREDANVAWDIYRTMYRLTDVDRSVFE